MQIFKEKEDLVPEMERVKSENRTIGFVPTMGALHQGHLFLVEQALASCDVVVVSIFVNPTQFDNPDDLQKYPRTLDSDVALLQSLDNNLIVFAPSASNLYGTQIKAEEFNFGGLENEMEGKYRQGHFNGVGTIVKKFFEIVKPDMAFFGEKDFQQLQIIKKLTQITQLPVQIVDCPINREETGLARSSRNERLEPELRKKSAVIYQILQKVKTQFGTKSASELTQWVKDQFDELPFLELEYFEIADSNTLKTVSEIAANKKYRAFIAAYAGEIRLIDNIALND